jgi:hypothetical protein
VDPYLIRKPLHGNTFQRPELNRIQVKDAAVSRIDIVELDSVVENLYAAQVAIDRGEFRRSQPAAAKRRGPRNPFEQIGNRESSTRKHLGTIP